MGSGKILMKRAGGVRMKITKYPQSCFLIEAEGKKILIDLGNLVFELHDIKLEDFREIDIVLLTHKHDDHCYPEALKTIVENNTPLILTNPEVQEIIEKAHSAGQDHIFKFWEELDDSQRKGLLEQIKETDFNLLENLIKQHIFTLIQQLKM